MKKILSFFLSVAVILNLFVMMIVPVSAVDFTKEGTIQSTGEPEENTIHWVITYDIFRKTARLDITGKGYIPNAVYDQTWHIALESTGCKLTEVTIGEGITSLMEGAFLGEDKLQKVTLPNSLEYIGDSAFAGTGLREIFLPKGVRLVKGTSFIGSNIKEFKVSADNPNITSVDGVVYSKDLKTLEAYPVARTKSESPLNFKIPETVEIIGEGAFVGAEINELEIPGSVKVVGKLSFASSTVKRLCVNSGVQAIYNNAFFLCPNLKEIHLPNSVGYVGMYSFGYMPEIDLEAIEFALDQENKKHDAVTEENAEYYANILGYSLDVFIYFAPVKWAKIYAPQGSAGEQYAINNEIKYYKSQALTPRVTTTQNQFNGVKVNWSESTDADGYYVYRKDLQNKWQRVATVKGGENTSYLDESAYSSRQNIYTVRAYNKSGSSACYLSGYLSDYFVKAPTVTKIYNTTDGVRINWKGVSGAKYYKIYRKESEDSKWQYKKKVNADTKYWLDVDVKDGDSYIYTIRTDNGKTLSLYNKAGYKNLYLEAPDFKVKNNVNGVKISWNNKINADNMRVYRKTRNSSWKLLSTVNTQNGFYIDSGVKSGENYIYTVRSKYGIGISGYDSNGKGISYVETPNNIKLTNAINGVKINWSKCENADGYFLYRMNETGHWIKIANLKGNNSTSFKDLNVQSGNDYLYTIRSYKGKALSDFIHGGVGVRFLGTPKLISAELKPDGAYIEFSEVNGCENYKVYRKINNGYWHLIGEVASKNGNVYVDKTAEPNRNYKYTVRASYKGQLSSFYSKGITL